MTRTRAVAALRAVLAAGPVAATEVFAVMGDAGYSTGQTNRARIAVGAQIVRHGYGPGSRSEWYLPDDGTCPHCGQPLVDKRSDNGFSADPYGAHQPAGTGSMETVAATPIGTTAGPSMGTTGTTGVCTICGKASTRLGGQCPFFNRGGRCGGWVL